MQKFGSQPLSALSWRLKAGLFFLMVLTSFSGDGFYKGRLHSAALSFFVLFVCLFVWLSSDSRAPGFPRKSNLGDAKPKNVFMNNVFFKKSLHMFSRKL